ncbi:MAG: beta-N-acetylglucosaminidase, partial [Gemmatimonadaceae bacterium]|nr:beta-N-acetylglucosaminidase [Gloeobacterales cyanobacterium ES-bin-141]
MMPMLQDLQDARILVERYGVGGFVCFRGEAAGFARQLNELQSMSRIPLLMSADFERGAGAYIDGATDLPIAMALGAAAQSDLAYQAGTITALEARALGVHVVFAPVLDVNNNPNNPIINVRSFGQSPALVSEMAAAYVKGLQDHGALATVKHFPGHGNTGTDSHLDLATVSASRREL